MVQKSASNFRLTVYNFHHKGYTFLYVYNKWLDLLNNDFISLEQLYIYVKRWKLNNLII